MELRQFRYFLSIVDHRSLSRAAQHLYVAQSALSKQVADLEAELGVKLLVRNSDGVVATDAGKVFYEYAQGITRQIGDVRLAVRHAAEVVAGSVIVAIPQSTSAMLAMPLLRAAAERYPNVVFHLNEELTGNMPEQMLSGRVDVAVFTTAMPMEGLDFVPLVEEDFVYLHGVTDAHGLPHGDVTLEVATARPIVTASTAHGQATRNVVDAILRERGLPPCASGIEVNSVHILKSVVEAGLGPTIMPLGLAAREVSDGRLVAHHIDCEGMTRTLGVCTSSHLPVGNAKRAIAEMIVDVMREVCDEGRWPGARYLGEVADKPAAADDAPCDDTSRGG